MSIFQKILSDEKGKIIISIIWGLGLAAIFRKVCNGRDCIVIKGPKPKDIDKNIYTFDNKCFKYEAKQTNCTN